MSKRVTVEEGLTGVKDLLEEEGYEVVSPGRSQGVMAVVCTGLDNNSMNMQDINTEVPVIDAAGKNPPRNRQAD